MIKAQLIEQVQQLKTALVEIEKQLAEDEVPVVVLEDFKLVVDHTRMTVWAVLSARREDPYEIGPTVRRFRLQRATEMCPQIRLDIDAGEIGVDSGELKEFHTTLNNTRDRINRLYTAGV